MPLVGRVPGHGPSSVLHQRKYQIAQQMGF